MAVFPIYIYRTGFLCLCMLARLRDRERWVVIVIVMWYRMYEGKEKN